MVIGWVYSQLAQGERQAAVDQLALDDVIPTRRQVDTALEPAVRKFKSVDHGIARPPRHGTVPGHDQDAVLDENLELLLGDAGQGYADREFLLGLHEVDRRLTGGLPPLRSPRHEELPVQTLRTVQQFAGFGPHPGAGVT